MYGARLAGDLAQVVSESIFDIPRLVEAARHPCLDPLLGRSPPYYSGSTFVPRQRTEQLLKKAP